MSINDYIDKIDCLRKDVRNDVIKTKDKSEQGKLTNIFLDLTVIFEKFKQEYEDVKLTDGTERYHK